MNHIAVLTTSVNNLTVATNKLLTLPAPTTDAQVVKLVALVDANTAAVNNYLSLATDAPDDGSQPTTGDTSSDAAADTTTTQTP